MDNSISWFAWELEPWQVDLLETTRFLTRLRRVHRVLRQRSFFSGRAVADDGSEDIAWYDVDGRVMSAQAWSDPASRTLSMYLDGAWLGEPSLLVTYHGGSRDTEVTLPQPPGLTAYTLLWDSAWPRPQEPTDLDLKAPVTMTAASIWVCRATDPT